MCKGQVGIPTVKMIYPKWGSNGNRENLFLDEQCHGGENFGLA